MAKLDPFTRSYIETMLWESTGGPNGDRPLNRDYTAEDFDPASLRRIVADTAAFQKEASEWYDDPRQAGHDFWLTRVGAGAGFWDGDYPEPEATLLTNASKRFGHVDVVEGEYGEGPLYLEPSAASAREHARRLEAEAFDRDTQLRLLAQLAEKKQSGGHATKKSPSQLDREIAEALHGGGRRVRGASSPRRTHHAARSSASRIDRRKLGEMMSPWGSDFSYGQGSGAVGAVSSYYYSDKKYPDRGWVQRALEAIEDDIPKAEHGAHGWTKKDARDLRKIAAGLRYYLIHDYKE